MFKLILTASLIFCYLAGVSQKVEYFELNDFISPAEFNFIKNARDITKTLNIFANSVGDGLTTIIKDLRSAKEDSENAFIYVNDALYTRYFQFNLKHFLYFTRDTLGYGFKDFHTSLKSKLQVGIYPFGGKTVGNLRLQASWNPIINFGKNVQNEWEFNYSGLLPVKTAGTSGPQNILTDYFLIDDPFLSRFYYGIEQFFPVYYTKSSIFRGFDVLFDYVRSNTSGIDKSDRLDLGLKIEYLKIDKASSIYMLTYYTANYAMKTHQLSVGLALIEPTFSKVSRKLISK